MIETLKNKSFMTNFFALLLVILGWMIMEAHVKSIGYYALSGAFTNWLAVYMLFEKIPFLYGSGVVPNQFAEFKKGIKLLIMNEFFNQDNIHRFFSEQERDFPLDLSPVVEKIDFHKIFDELVNAIHESSFGAMLAMFGGKEALMPLEEPVTNKLKQALIKMGQDEHFNQILAEAIAEQTKQSIQGHVEKIIDSRLQELTPKMVKEIVQAMIGKHLGWLVVWGGVFGGAIGFILSFF